GKTEGSPVQVVNLRTPFQLESLEPRVLLSAQGLSAAPVVSRVAEAPAVAIEVAFDSGPALASGWDSPAERSAPRLDEILPAELPGPVETEAATQIGLPAGAGVAEPVVETGQT